LPNALSTSSTSSAYRCGQDTGVRKRFRDGQAEEQFRSEDQVKAELSRCPRFGRRYIQWSGRIVVIDKNDPVANCCQARAVVIRQFAAVATAVHVRLAGEQKYFNLHRQICIGTSVKTASLVAVDKQYSQRKKEG
jgi:hypothetical protein